MACVCVEKAPHKINNNMWEHKSGVACMAMAATCRIAISGIGLSLMCILTADRIYRWYWTKGHICVHVCVPIEESAHKNMLKLLSVPCILLMQQTLCRFFYLFDFCFVLAFVSYIWVDATEMEFLIGFCLDWNKIAATTKETVRCSDWNCPFSFFSRLNGSVYRGERAILMEFLGV